LRPTGSCGWTAVASSGGSTLCRLGARLVLPPPPPAQEARPILEGQGLRRRSHSLSSRSAVPPALRPAAARSSSSNWCCTAACDCVRMPRSRIGDMRWRAHQPVCLVYWLTTRWTWSKCACKVSVDALRSLCGSGRARRGASDTTDNGNGQQQGDCHHAARGLTDRPYASACEEWSLTVGIWGVCYTAVQDGHNPHAPMYRGFVHALKTIARDEVREPARPATRG
jgi:hypothetical protein